MSERLPEWSGEDWDNGYEENSVSISDGSVRYTNIPSGTVAYWPLDSDATDSVGTYDGTVSGASFVEDSVRGPVADLDGSSDYIMFPNDGTFAGLPEISWSFWIKQDQFPSGTYIHPIRLREHTLNVQWDGRSGYEHFRITVTDSAGNTFEGIWNEYPQVTEWHHIISTYDSSSFTLYADGSEISSVSTNGSNLESSTNDIYTKNNGYGQHWDGRLDDIRFYDRALSASEVSDLHLIESA